jgi:hypothetical protein
MLNMTQWYAQIRCILNRHSFLELGNISQVVGVCSLNNDQSQLGTVYHKF